MMHQNDMCTVTSEHGGEISIFTWVEYSHDNATWIHASKIASPRESYPFRRVMESTRDARLHRDDRVTITRVIEHEVRCVAGLRLLKRKGQCLQLVLS